MPMRIARTTPGATLALALGLSLILPLPPRSAPPSPPDPQPASDPFSWLEEVNGARALDWVKAHNAATASRLRALPAFDGLHHDALAVLDSASRLPAIEPHGGYLYNFWQDSAHPRGLYRRTTLDSLRLPAPRWETVLDLDALAAREGKPWAFGGVTWRQPDETRCLIHLSAGGGDAAETREFDASTLAFVPGGFVVPVSKSRTGWLDADTLAVGTDFGPGSLSASGYPLVVKAWHRGTPLAAAGTLYTASPASFATAAGRLYAAEGSIDLVHDLRTFWTSRVLQQVGGGLVPLDIPPKTRVVGNFRGRLVLWLKEDWNRAGTLLRADSILIADPAALRGGPGAVETVVPASPGAIVNDVDVLKDGILVSALDNVRARLARYVPARPAAAGDAGGPGTCQRGRLDRAADRAPRQRQGGDHRR